MRLQHVIVFAKSKFGKGSVRLMVGPEATKKQRIDGSPRNFHSRSKRSYDTIDMVSPFFESWGPWRLQFYGNIIIDKVVLVTEKRAAGLRRERRSHPSLGRAEPIPHNVPVLSMPGIEVHLPGVGFRFDGHVGGVEMGVVSGRHRP